MGCVQVNPWLHNTVNILVSVCNMHWIHKSVVNVLLKLQKDARFHLRIIMPSVKPYEVNLNGIVINLLNWECEFWLNIDDDNPPLNNPLDLIELDKDVIGLPTPIWHNSKPGDRPIYWSAYDYDKEADAYREHQIYEGLQKVDAIGTGCFLASRRVFEHPNMQNGCFLRKYDSQGMVERGNDLAFCERAKENGFSIWTHYDYRCDQFTELSLEECFNAFKRMK